MTGGSKQASAAGAREAQVPGAHQARTDPPGAGREEAAAGRPAEPPPAGRRGESAQPKEAPPRVRVSNRYTVLCLEAEDTSADDEAGLADGIMGGATGSGAGHKVGSSRCEAPGMRKIAKEPGARRKHRARTSPELALRGQAESPGRGDSPSSAAAAASLQGDGCNTATDRSNTAGPSAKDVAPEDCTGDSEEKADAKGKSLPQEAASIPHCPDSVDGKKGLDADNQPVGPPQVERSSTRKLTEDQADVLALLPVRLNEHLLACRLRETSSRAMIVATPVDPVTSAGKDMLELEPGTLVHCELVDKLGFAFGTIVAPARLTGHSGCFRLEGMRPVTVELHRHSLGEALHSTVGSWNDMDRLSAPSAQQRLRRKAMLRRMELARAAWTSLHADERAAGRADK